MTSDLASHVCWWCSYFGEAWLAQNEGKADRALVESAAKRVRCYSPLVRHILPRLNGPPDSTSNHTGPAALMHCSLCSSMRHNAQPLCVCPRMACRQVPKQDNFSDCGVFVLKYSEMFLRDHAQPWSSATGTPSQDQVRFLTHSSVFSPGTALLHSPLAECSFLPLLADCFLLPAWCAVWSRCSRSGSTPWTWVPCASSSCSW